MTVVTIKKNNTYSAEDLFQWDTGRVLEICGLNLSALPEIHFANSRTENAIVKQAEKYENGVITVTIPNVLLETASPLRVFVCTHDGDKFISRYTFTINVKARPRPEDYIADDDEKIYSYNALENLVNNTLVDLREENASFHEEITAENEELYNRFVEAVTSLGENIVRDVDNLNAATEARIEENLTQAINLVKELESHTTTFNADGSVTTTCASGASEHVIFNADGSITRRFTLENQKVMVSDTVFNSNGTISTTIREEV